MPAPNEMVWYKWFPAKALTSLRWSSLTLEQEGFYRRLYDIASLAQPSNRRGWVYEHDRPASLTEIFHALRIHHSTGHALVRQLADKGLLTQDENGAWGFPNFHKHQWHAPLRQRTDGLGTAESGDKRAELGGKRALDAEAYTKEADAEKEALVDSPKPESTNEVFRELVTLWNTAPDEHVRKCRSLNPQHASNVERYRKLKTKLAQEGGLEELRLAVRRVADGKCLAFPCFPNRPGFEFLFQANGASKINEGGHDKPWGVGGIPPSPDIRPEPKPLGGEQ